MDTLTQTIQPKVHDKFAAQTFLIRNDDGKVDRLTASELNSNPKFYIERGYGHYFNIEQKAAQQIVDHYQKTVVEKRKALEDSVKNKIQLEKERADIAEAEKTKLMASKDEAEARLAEALKRLEVLESADKPSPKDSEGAIDLTGR